MTIKYTRKQRLNNECTHEQYFGQFANDKIKEIVVGTIGEDRLLKSSISGEEAFNDIPLKTWDIMGNFINTDMFHTSYKKTGDFVSKSVLTCVLKEAARQIVETKLNN